MTTPVRPIVTLKLATSLDGKIALANGQSKWITGPDSRAEVHRLRAAHAAILTGVGTILADDPELTARTDPAPSVQPDLIVMDSTLRCPLDARIVETTDRRRVTLVSADTPGAPLDGDRVRAFVDKQVQMRRVAAVDGRPDLSAAMDEFASVMIEAGAQIAASALRAGLVDRIEWFRAPVILGGDGLSVLAGLGLESLDRAPMFTRTAVTERGADIQESYQRVR